MSKPRTPWQLDALLRADRNALTVYGTLRWMAGDKRQLGTTRRRIRAICGLCEKRISAAMKALDAAGWLTLRYGHSQAKTWYRIAFCSNSVHVFPVGPKRPHRRNPRGAEKAPQGIVPCRAEKAPLPHKGNRRGAARVTAASPAPDGMEESRAARIERERMATIRRKREKREAAERAEAEAPAEAQGATA